MASAAKTDYELERDRRIAENKRKLEELGVADAAAALNTSKPVVKRQKKAKAAVSEDSSLERRVSSRERKAVNYCEMEARTAREPKAPVDYSERIKAMTLDQETAEQLRKEAADKKGSSKSGGKARGPVDSGKGVRIQGGRVYDSAHGVTCHWCRQKTLEDHVTCTNPDCGSGRRMPLSFCAKCLRNRHGEDCAAAEASNGWWCPTCRGSCGAGCVGCCNCGLCRKKMGLEPTHQVVRLARDAGFDNVHDYLVHLVTGETQEVIAARKLQFPWGRWLKEGGGEDEEEEEQEAGGSEASAQTGGGKAGCSHHHHHRSKGSSLSDDVDKEADKDQGPTSAPAAGRGKGRAAKKGAAGKAKGGKKGKKGAAAAAAAEAEVEAEAKREEEAPAEEPEEDDVPMLSSQDMTLPRKQRIMQALGLAPSTVITKC